MKNVFFALFAGLLAGNALATNSSLGISIPQCNNVSVVSASGTAIVLNCGSVTPVPPTPPGPTPPSPPGVISCTGFNRTVTVDQNWAAPTRQYASMGVNDAVVIRFTTGSVSTTTSLPRMTAAEYNSPPSTK